MTWLLLEILFWLKNLCHQIDTQRKNITLQTLHWKFGLVPLCKPFVYPVLFSFYYSKASPVFWSFAKIASENTYPKFVIKSSENAVRDTSALLCLNTQGRTFYNFLQLFTTTATILFIQVLEIYLIPLLKLLGWTNFRFYLTNKQIKTFLV